MAITSDNAVNNVTMMHQLGNLIDDHLGVDIEDSWDPTAHWVRCFAHTLNLVAQATLNGLWKELGDNVDAFEQEAPERLSVDDLSKLSAYSRAVILVFAYSHCIFFVFTLVFELTMIVMTDE